MAAEKLAEHYAQIDLPDGSDTQPFAINNAGRIVEVTIRGFLLQVRSFGRHRDRVTGVDLAFAGQDPRGVSAASTIRPYPPVSAGARRRNSISPQFRLLAYR